MRRARGFTLTELAVVLTIVAILVSSLMWTLSAQSEQRAREDTQRKLDQAKELVLAFAVANGRLPCPARCSNSPFCVDGGDEAVAAGVCTDSYAGYLPGRAIGFQPIDGAGYAVDAWGNRIRYAVSALTNGAQPNHFTNRASLQTNGIATTPTDLVVCASTAPAGGGFNAAANPPVCGGVGNANLVTAANTVAAVVWSHGKNYAAMPAGNVDEQINNKHRLPGALNNNAAFVWHDPRPVGGVGGEYDDLMVWIPAGQLYGRLISAGVLP